MQEPLMQDGSNMKRSSLDVITGKITESEIPQEEIDEAAAANKLAFDALTYAEKRQTEYPTIQECVHAILDDDLTALQEKRTEIKKKYPKG